MSERNIGANNPILTVLNHPGKPAGVESWDRPGDEPQRPPTKNERKVQAWRESGKAQEPISLPECGAIGAEMDNVSGGAKTGVESGEISRISFRMIDGGDWSQVTATANGMEYTFQAPDAVAVALLDASKTLYRLEIAEAGWTKARMDTDAMTREIERMKDQLTAARLCAEHYEARYKTAKGEGE
jgi:hypothetical protein